MKVIERVGSSVRRSKDDHQEGYPERAADLTCRLVDRAADGKSVLMQARDRGGAEDGKVMPIPNPMISVPGSQTAR